MKPLTTDPPRTTMLHQSSSAMWSLDRAQQQRLLSESAGLAEPSGSSTSSNSPPFTVPSGSSPLEPANGTLAIPNTTYGSHTVGPHRRQLSASRNSTSSDNIYGSLSQSATHPRPGHPYAFPTSLPTHHGILHNYASRNRRFSTQLESMTEDQRLEDLWTMHGVTGSAHLGMGLTDQLRATNLVDGDWMGVVSASRPMEEAFDPALYDTVGGTDHFTVGQNLRESFELHNPFTEGLFQFPAGDVLTSRDAEMDIGEDVPDARREESPLSEEQELVIRKKTTSDDSDATAGPLESTPVDEEEKDGMASDHETHGDEKTQSSKPSTNNFVHKLHLMISDPKAADFIWWTDLGTSFIVSSAGEFSREILGQHFKHNNFASFVRQLNMYGFHKINRTPRNQRVQPDAQQWEFSHPKFLRGRLDLLEDIRRRPVEPDPSSARTRVELPSEVAAKLREMALDHAEVVAALQFERRRVLQLSAIVKILYERLAPAGSPFPHELLEPGPPLRKFKESSMEVSGDSLVRSNPELGANPRASTGTRSKRPRTETDFDQLRGARDPNTNGRTNSNGGNVVKQETFGLGR